MVDNGEQPDPELDAVLEQLKDENVSVVYGDPEGFDEDAPTFDPEDYLQQLLGEQGTPPDLPPMGVRRYWLDEASFRAIAVLEQDGNAALVLSDGENQIVLFDSVSQEIDGLYLLAQVVDTAIAVLEDPGLSEIVNEAMEEEPLGDEFYAERAEELNNE